MGSVACADISVRIHGKTDALVSILTSKSAELTVLDE